VPLSGIGGSAMTVRPSKQPSVVAPRATSMTEKAASPGASSRIASTGSS
jgi:hypothetical protein